MVWTRNMDIQYIGEKTGLVTCYCTKYVSKPEKSYATETMAAINSTTSLSSLLCNLGMRMRNHRECGAPECADTLLGLSLHGTDSNTTIRWLDVNILRSRKLKTRKEIEELEGESTDIFCPSLIDDHYPNGPKELESMHLYNFAMWYDVTKNKSSEKTEYYEIRASLFFKKRAEAILSIIISTMFKFNLRIIISHYYYYSNLGEKPVTAPLRGRHAGSGRLVE